MTTINSLNYVSGRLRVDLLLLLCCCSFGRFIKFMSRNVNKIRELRLVL